MPKIFEDTKIYGIWLKIFRNYGKFTKKFRFTINPGSRAPKIINGLPLKCNTSLTLDERLFVWSPCTYFPNCTCNQCTYKRCSHSSILFYFCSYKIKVYTCQHPFPVTRNNQNFVHSKMPSRSGHLNFAGEFRHKLCRGLWPTKMYIDTFSMIWGPLDKFRQKRRRNLNVHFLSRLLK